jgi:pyrroline-5-carboxylate reductase
MAKAIMKGLVSSKMKTSVELTAYDTDSLALASVKKLFKAKPAASNQALVKECDVIFLAIKPQVYADILSPLKPDFTAGKLIISIMAGLSVKKIQAVTGKVPVVRVMPNMPALVGEGACGYCASKEASKKQMLLAETILDTFNRIKILLPEKQLDTVTAISGSGPAYFFYFAEAVMEASKELGFDIKDAKKLIAQTMIGAGQVMLESEDTPEVLRQKVTSKGGTTQKAIETMEKSGMKNIIKDAIKAAKNRSEELGK